MKKIFKNYVVIWMIAVIIFNILCFVTPNEIPGYYKINATFWVVYILIMIAFAGQLYCANIAFKAENAKKLFYNMPLITISYAGLAVMLIVGGLCMAIPDLPAWLGAILCILVLGFTAISVTKAATAADIVQDTDSRIEADTLFIKSLTADAESLISKAKTEEAAKACKKVYEAIRYSDPMSNPALAGLESQIAIKFSEFSKAVENGEDIGNLGGEVITLVDDRNKKCKLMK